MTFITTKSCNFIKFTFNTFEYNFRFRIFLYFSIFAFLDFNSQFTAFSIPNANFLIFLHFAFWIPIVNFLPILCFTFWVPIVNFFIPYCDLDFGSYLSILDPNCQFWVPIVNFLTVLGFAFLGSNCQSSYLMPFAFLVPIVNFLSSCVLHFGSNCQFSLPFCILHFGFQLSIFLPFCVFAFWTQIYYHSNFTLERWQTTMNIQC